MGKENNKLMIIRRCLSPPTENPVEVIYAGKWLDLKQISEAVNMGSEEARKYWYGISRLEMNNNELMIYDRVAVYEGILNPGCCGIYGKSICLTLNDSAKKDLIKLLQIKD